MPKPSRLNRRDFIKTSVAGALLAASVKDAWGESPAPVAPKSGPVLAEEGSIFRSDLSHCTPAGRLGRDFDPARWQLLNYETEKGVKGVMATAKPEHDCGVLTLPLEAKGPHRIFIGINYTKISYDSGSIEVRLTGEPGFRRVEAEGGVNLPDGTLKIGVNNDNFKSVQEAYWKTADLTGKSLEFRQPGAPYNRQGSAGLTNLTYVRLVPLSPAELARWEETKPTPDSRRLAQIYCTAGLTGNTAGSPTFHPTDEQWFRNEFAPYVGSDFRLFLFEAMRGNFCLFKTKLGDVGTPDNRWGADWVDPLAAFTRLAHEHDMKIFATLRLIGTQFPMNREPIARARNYWKNPEWAKRDRDGVPMSNLSLAYPGVRQHWLGLLRETLAYGTDGIQLHLNRSMPAVGYEEPVLKSFQEKHGEDPRRLPENDPRWEAHRAGYLTQFLREVRALLNEQPGRELGVTVYGEPTKYDLEKAGYEPLRYTCDVDTWIREQLVDYLMPNPYIDLALLKKWRALGGDRLHLWPDLMPRTQLPASYARLAKKYYDAGADGLCVWDGEGRTPRLSEWAAVQRLGHRAQLDRLAAEASSFYRRVPLKYLDGISVRESFHDG